MAQARRSGASPASPAYDARYFDCELHRDHWFRNNAAKRARRWREILRMLEPRTSDRILEIGCGAGEHALPLARHAGFVVGIDRAFAGILRAKARADGDHVENAWFATCDAAALPFADGSFHKVAAIDFVEHLADPLLVRTLGETHRLLKPGGLLAIYTPCITHYVEWMKAHNIVLRQIPGHIAVRGPAAYTRLLQGAGFAIESCSFLPSDYPLFGVLDRALGVIPGIGAWFRFRICIVAHKAPAN